MKSNEELLWEISNGNKYAKEELIIKNTPLIYKIISEFYYLCNDHMVKEDLFQAGCFGLLKAMKGYDLNYNTKFTTYAYKYVRGEILRVVESELKKDITFTDCLSKEGETDDLCHEEIADYLNLVLGEEKERPSEDEALDNVLKDEILKIVTEKQRKILMMRYMGDMTQEEIGAKLGLHQVEISREEKRARKLICSFSGSGKSCLG